METRRRDLRRSRRGRRGPTAGIRSFWTTTFVRSGDDGRLSRSERRDLGWTMLCGFLAAAVVMITAGNEIATLFAPEGISVTMRFFTGDPAGVLPLGTADAPARVTEARLAAPDTPTVSVVSLVVAAALRALGRLVVIGCVITVCRNVALGRVFCRANTRMVWTAAIALMVSTAFVYLFTVLGVNGAAASIGFDGVDARANMPPDYWPSLFAGVLLCPIAIAFRAGERMQRDSEGLV